MLPGWMAFVTALDGAYVSELAARRFARTALVSPTNRLTLEFVSPVFGEIRGLGLLCLLKRFLISTDLFPWRLI